MDFKLIAWPSDKVRNYRLYFTSYTASDFKKNELKPWLKKEWCIPAENSAEFVCRMEDVLDVYKRPYNVDYPVTCMDEASKQQGLIAGSSFFFVI